MGGSNPRRGTKSASGCSPPGGPNSLGQRDSERHISSVGMWDCGSNMALNSSGLQECRTAGALVMYSYMVQ